MSMPCVLFDCASCDFKASSMCTWGPFEYDLGEAGVVRLERRLAWCYHCDDVVPMEYLSDMDELTRDRDRTSARLSSLRGNDGFLMRLRNSFGDRRARINMAEETLAEADLRIAFLRKRSSPPKCLFCGEDRVTALDLELFDESQPVAMGFQHPNCGGEIWMRMSDFSMWPQTMRRVYDFDGQLLSEE